MREVAIRIWDDLEHKAGRRIEAQVTVTIGLNGYWAELDLTAENEACLRQDLRKWLDAGHEPEVAPAPPGEKAKKSTWNTREWEHGKEWGSAIRAFADENGISYVTKSGKWYYSRALRDAYAASIGRD